jgi:hypothetical protein
MTTNRQTDSQDGPSARSDRSLTHLSRTVVIDGLVNIDTYAPMS